MNGFRLVLGGDQYYWRDSYKSACECEKIFNLDMQVIKRNSLRRWAAYLIEDDRRDRNENQHP